MTNRPYSRHSNLPMSPADKRWFWTGVIMIVSVLALCCMAWKVTIDKNARKQQIIINKINKK